MLPAIVRCLLARRHPASLIITRAELNLTEQADIRAFFATEKPGQVNLVVAVTIQAPLLSRKSLKNQCVTTSLVAYQDMHFSVTRLHFG